MGELSKLPNIGSNIEEKLKQVGITSYEQLKEVGSKEAWLRMRKIDEGACINSLCALEGAIQGIRWHSLSEDIKIDLKDFYKQMTSSN